MGWHFSFRHLKHKLWPKEEPQKVGNRPDLLGYRWRAIYRWKALDESYNFLHITFWLKVCSQNYGVPKLREAQLGRFRDSQVKILGKKNHLDVGYVASHRRYYKGEGGGFLKVRAMVSLVCPCCLWLVLAPRVL
jgi:hypothetical protein